jgi:hypothetical protein
MTEKQRKFEELSPKVKEIIQSAAINNDLDSLRKDAALTDEQFIKYVMEMVVPIRLSFKWIGIERRVGTEQQMAVAETLHADVDMHRTVRKLYNTDDRRWAGIKNVRNEAVRYWIKSTIDYPPEKGIRLLRRCRYQEFRQTMETFHQRLYDEVEILNPQLPDIIRESERLLGSSFDPNCYPDTFTGQFDMTYSFPSVEAALSIKEMNPQHWIDECSRVRENLDEAFHKAEELFVKELSDLTGHLAERLTTEGKDGKPATLRASSVANIYEFIERIHNLNVCVPEDVSKLVSQMEQALGESSAETLRKDREWAQSVAENMNKIKEQADKLLVRQQADKEHRINERHVRIRRTSKIA